MRVCGWDTENLGQGGRVRLKREMKPCPEDVLGGGERY